MAAWTTLTGRMGRLHYCILLSALIFFLIGSVCYLDVLPDRKFLASKLYSVAHLGAGAYSQLGIPNSDHEPDRLGNLEHNNCQSYFDRLRRLSLSNTIRYSRRCIQPVYSDTVDRDVVSDISSSPLVKTAKALDLSDECPLETGELSCDDRIALPVPPPDPENKGQYRHLVFGVATTCSRLRDSKSTFAHWLADSGAILIGLVTDSTQDLPGLNLSALEDEYASSGVTLELAHKHDAHHTTEQSHMLIIRDMLAASPAAHWLGILDDDTFFPSLHALSTALAAHDHTRPAYLGQLTEHAQLLAQGILGAFGGAGIFLSHALARELEPHLDTCLGGGGGDMQIMECVHAHSAARLTRVDGLWQADLIGDSAGFYESGRRVLSMHHWKSWNWLPVAEMAAVTRVCGDCFLERFAFGRGGDQGERAPVTVLHNGYSIAVYDGSLGLPDLSRTEQTWDDWDDKDPWKDYEWSLGPLRPKVAQSMKRSYWLAAARADEQTGALVQVYLHRGAQDGEDDEVVELVWQAS